MSKNKEASSKLKRLMDSPIFQAHRDRGEPLKRFAEIRKDKIRESWALGWMFGGFIVVLLLLGWAVKFTRWDLQTKAWGHLSAYVFAASLFGCAIVVIATGLRGIKPDYSSLASPIFHAGQALRISDAVYTLPVEELKRKAGRLLEDKAQRLVEYERIIGDRLKTIPESAYIQSLQDEINHDARAAIQRLAVEERQRFANLHANLYAADLVKQHWGSYFPA